MNNAVHICFAPDMVTEKPQNDPLGEIGYRMIVPYKFDWRDKLGKAVCDCQTVIEMYRPWYGYSWHHSNECAIYKHLRRFPGILNLVEWNNIIAHTN